MAAHRRRPDDGLLERRNDELNLRFYSSKPWQYFQTRLGLLALVSSDPDRLAELLGEPISVDRVTLSFEWQETERSVPSAVQTFRAIEGDALLHHAAEVLLRYVHAHASPDPCPWLRMSRIRGAGMFKSWVQENVVDAPEKRLAICEHVFALAPRPGQAEGVSRWVKRLADHFMAAGSYNAAKHGLAIEGGDQELTLSFEDEQVLASAGTVISWVDSESADREDGSRRWAAVQRIYSLEATLVLVMVASWLMESIWNQARWCHLTTPLQQPRTYPEPTPVHRDGLGIVDRVLSEFVRPLPYDGEEETMILRVPVPRPDDGGPSAAATPRTG